MKIALLLIACSLIAPASAIGQALTSAQAARDSLTVTYAAIKTNRAGISLDQSFERKPLRIRSDSTATSGHVGAHIIHALVGGLLGTVAGLAIGAVAGAVIDAHGNGDATYPATLGLAYFGAIVGLPVGALVGAIWPVK